VVAVQTAAVVRQDSGSACDPIHDVHVQHNDDEYAEKADMYLSTARLSRLRGNKTSG